MNYNEYENKASKRLAIEKTLQELDWLRSLTAKPSRNATQRERNIYQAATRLLSNLDENEPIKFCNLCNNETNYGSELCYYHIEKAHRDAA